MKNKKMKKYLLGILMVVLIIATVSIVPTISAVGLKTRLKATRVAASPNKSFVDDIVKHWMDDPDIVHIERGKKGNCYYAIAYILVPDGGE